MYSNFTMESAMTVLLKVRNVIECAGKKPNFGFKLVAIVSSLM